MRAVRVNSGYMDIEMPDGSSAFGPTVVMMSDEQYATLNRASFEAESPGIPVYTDLGSGCVLRSTPRGQRKSTLVAVRVI